jgi:DNA-3-methyladenine glycosylase I
MGITEGYIMKNRCAWVGEDPLMKEYHDTEWGVPLHTDDGLFEFLILEGFQAGLSWSTILKKRTAFNRAFDNFDPEKIIDYDEEKIEELMSNKAIIRNPLKIRAAVENAQCLLRIREEFDSFDTYIWQFVDFEPIQNAWKSIEDIPPHTSLSRSMSADLKERGFKFVGPTICYSFMQAVGMVNDHTIDCFRYTQVQTG